MIHMLEEHESRKGPPSPEDGEEPSAEERALLSKVKKKFHASKEYRSKYDQKWLDFYKFFRGRQWKESRPTYRHSEVINFVFQAIQATVPIITDKQPRVEFLPVEPGDRLLSELLNEIKNNDWESQNWLMVLTELLYDAHIYGTGFARVEYDPKEQHGLGRIKFETLDPFHCFPDPASTDVNSNGSFFIHAEPMSLDMVRGRWPGKGRLVKSDIIDIIDGDRTSLAHIKFKSPTDNKTYIETSEPLPKVSDERALVVTCYFYDYDEIEEVEVSEGKKERKLKYPQGRRIVYAGNVILESGPNPYEDGKFPFLRIQNYVLPREFYGISEVEQLESPQKVFNMLMSYTLDVLTLMGNPIWIIDENSGIDIDNIYNRPGLIVEKHPGTEVRREAGVQLQPFVVNIIDRMQSWFNEVSGSTDVSSGAQPGSVRAGFAIQALQEASQTRLRLKSRVLDAFLTQLGQLYVSRVFQFYTFPRIFRITQKEAASQFFKFSVEPGENFKKVVRVRQLMGSENEEAIVSEEKQFSTSATFDIKSSTGSGLPFAKSEKANLAFNLYDRQIIDAEEVLKAVDYPNREVVIERMKQKLEAVALAQAEAAGIPPISGVGNV